MLAVSMPVLDLVSMLTHTHTHTALERNTISKMYLLLLFYYLFTVCIAVKQLVYLCKLVKCPIYLQKMPKGQNQKM